MEISFRNFIIVHFQQIYLLFYFNIFHQNFINNFKNLNTFVEITDTFYIIYQSYWEFIKHYFKIIINIFLIYFQNFNIMVLFNYLN